MAIDVAKLKQKRLPRKSHAQAGVTQPHAIGLEQHRVQPQIAVIAPLLMQKRQRFGELIDDLQHIRERQPFFLPKRRHSIEQHTLTALAKLRHFHHQHRPLLGQGFDIDHL